MKPETQVQNHVVGFYRELGCHVVPIKSYSRNVGRVVPAGFPDLVVMHFRTGVFFHETKTEAGKLSEDQLKFRRECMLRSITYLAGGLDTARAWAKLSGIINGPIFYEEPHEREDGVPRPDARRPEPGQGGGSPVREAPPQAG